MKTYVHVDEDRNAEMYDLVIDKNIIFRIYVFKV